MTHRPTRFSVRRLAVLDLYGARGTIARRRTVLIEFLLAPPACALIGTYQLRHGDLTGWLDGMYVLGVGSNYPPLSVYALQLRARKRLDTEARLIADLDAERRYYSVAQARLLVPVWVLILDIDQRRRQLHARRSRRVQPPRG